MHVAIPGVHMKCNENPAPQDLPMNAFDAINDRPEIVAFENILERFF